MDTPRQCSDHRAVVKSMSDMALEYVEQRLPLTVRAYDKLIEDGLLTPLDRVELVEGRLIEVPPQEARHASTIARLNRAFARLATRALIWVQLPLIVSGNSEPEPDFCLLRPREDFYGSAKPRAADAFTVVEVLDARIAFDRGVKLRMYAKARVAEYWIADVPRKIIEAYRRPHRGEYRTITTARKGDSIAFAAFPDVVFAVDELLG